MNCIIVTDEELLNRGLIRFINRLPVYMRGSPASIEYNPWHQVYVVPESNPAVQKAYQQYKMLLELAR